MNNNNNNTSNGKMNYKTKSNIDKRSEVIK